MSFETITDILQIIFADIILSGDNALVIGMAAAGWTPRDATQSGRQALTAFMKRSRMTTGSIVITGIFALPLSHLQTMIVISPEFSAS